MKTPQTDLLIIGAGPVGLCCAYLANLCGLSTIIVDQSAEPLQVGRADALNARSLQLLEIVDLFSSLYPLGKTCNTSSIFSRGKFISRQSSWWEALSGCLHPHFLMLGQAYLEQLLDQRLNSLGCPVRRDSQITHVARNSTGCITRLHNGEHIHSTYLIGADGARSLVRQQFNIGFTIEKPEITWAVIDGVIDTDFPKVPEIIVFQNDTADVAWIPREAEIDRFYIRIDNLVIDEPNIIKKIEQALAPYRFSFKEIIWSSRFSVKESVADRFAIKQRVFLAGDACHIHSVNGGQGLNTGLADAFNLIWKIYLVHHHGFPSALLQTYEQERQPIAHSVIETSGKLVRATKFSEHDSHANDYVNLIATHAGNITGMGIRYSQTGLVGTRLFDMILQTRCGAVRLYSLLNYTRYTLLIFSDHPPNVEVPRYVKVIQISSAETATGDYWSQQNDYTELALLVRPDSYIAAVSPSHAVSHLVESQLCNAAQQNYGADQRHCGGTGICCRYRICHWHHQL